MPDASGGQRPCRVKFESTETLPNCDWIEANAPESAAIAELDGYETTVDEMVYGSTDADRPKHDLLGHPVLIQWPWELECQFVTNGIACDGSTDYDDPRAAALTPGAKDWRLLLQIDSDEAGPGWMWGDSGMLYFAIPEAALKARAFDKAWMIKQSC